MKEVSIAGIIGYDWLTDSGITKKTVEKQLEGITDNEDIKITIDSPGGSVYEGVVIFNLIRDYAKKHPVSVRINCRAMSMGLYIALAPRTVNKDAKITVSENSIAMAHNPWGWSCGDYRDLRKDADYFEKLAALYGSALSISGKSEKEIRALMDEETYYTGKEIFENGFANDFEAIIQTENESALGESSASGKRDALIASARLEMEGVRKIAEAAKAKDAKAYRGDIEKAVALYTGFKPPAAASTKTDGKNNSGGLMTLEELKAQNKALYDEVFAQGVTAGINKERVRVNAHLLLGEKSGSLALAAKHIKAGIASNDEAVQAEYYAAKLDSAHIDARKQDNVGDVHTGGESGAAIDDAKLESAFDNGFAGKNTRGQSWEE
jgi:ATP-dependent protease ClpP protease subunit